MKHLLTLTLTLALLASALTAPSASATVHGTDFEKKIVFSPSATALAKIGETSWTDFPVLVRLPASVSSQLQSADGTDLYIEDENGTSLPFEIDTFEPAGETLVWVKVPSLSTATDLTVYFGGASNVDNAPTAVWTDYVGVWHMNEASGTVADATGNGLGASPAKATVVSVAQASGAVGTARQTATSNVKDYLSIPNYNTQNVGANFTFSCFYDATARKGYDRLVSRKETHDAGNGWEVEMANSSSKLSARGASATSISGTFSDLVSSGWMRFTFVYSGTTLTAFLNGAQIGTGTIAAATDNGKPLSIGCDSDGSEAYFVGYVDEARLRRGAASAAEVALEYATMADATFFDAGAVEDVDATAQKFQTPTVERNANGTYTVTVVLSENSGDVGVIYDDGASATTNILATAANPGTFTDTPANLTPDTTYKFAAYGKNANGTEVVEKGGVFHTGDLSVAKVSDANENGLVPGSFRVSRADTAHDLVVNLSVGGTATVGQTYEALPATVTIPAGASSVDVPVVPIMDKATDADATVTVTLAAGLYGVSASAGTATLTIANLVAPAGYNTWVASAAGLASDGSNWSEGRAPTASDNILFDGRFSTANCTWDTPAAVASWTQAADYTGTVQIETTYASGAFPLLSIAGDCAVNGGMWTHHTNTNVANGAAAQYRLNVSVGGDFTLGSGAKIDVIGRGYNVGRCPSGSQVGVHAATGRGTYSAVYGDVHAPEDIGSGGENSNKNSSAGGGAVKIAVAGAAVIDGTIAANACSQRLNGNNPEKGYGAGGSVFVTASSISGSGKVDVSARPAGVSETAYTGYPGSGGRMALVATSGSVTIPMANLLANGSFGGYSAGAGTIFLKNASDTNGSLLVGNSATTWSYIVRYPRKDGCTCVKPGETWTFDHVYVRDSGILSVPANATLSLPGGFESVSSLTDSSTPLCGILYLGGTISLPVRQEHVLSGPWMFMAAEPFTFDGDVRLTSKASIGSLQLYADTIAAYPACKVSVTGNMTVESGATLYAQNRGIKGGSSNPGFGYHGGSVANQTADLSKLFDSILNPVLCGSGARNGDMGNTNPGGGAIVLTVGGTLTLNGNANAGTSAVVGFHVGGAGTINITAGSLAGTGSITANGGSGSGAKSRGSGGGGRVAVRLTGANATFDGFSGTIAAQGANANSATTPFGSSAGTVYLQDGDTAAGAGTIRVANLSGSTAVDAKTGFPALSNGEPIDDLSKATLAISNNSTVILVADVKVGTLDIASGSKIDLNGHTITVKRAKLGDTKFSSGEYTAADAEVAGFVTDSVGGGSLVARGIGTVLLLN